MTADDIALLVDLLHLPYRHGPRAEALLGLLDGVRAAPADAALRAAFLAATAQVEGLFERLTEIRQRELCYTLYPTSGTSRRSSTSSRGTSTGSAAAAARRHPGNRV